MLVAWSFLKRWLKVKKTRVWAFFQDQGHLSLVIVTYFDHVAFNISVIISFVPCCEDVANLWPFTNIQWQPSITKTWSLKVTPNFPNLIIFQASKQKIWRCLFSSCMFNYSANYRKMASIIFFNFLIKSIVKMCSFSLYENKVSLIFSYFSKLWKRRHLL